MNSSTRLGLEGPGPTPGDGGQSAFAADASGHAPTVGNAPVPHARSALFNAIRTRSLTSSLSMLSSNWVPSA